MEFTPTPQQLLFLWCVVISPPGTAVKDLPYALKPAKRRDQLQQLGWIIIDKVSKGKRSKVQVARLTEEGWYGLERNLSAPLSRLQSPAIARVLQTVLTSIRRRIDQGELSLADLLLQTVHEVEPDKSGEAESAHSAQPTLKANTIKRRIFDACRHIVGDGVYGVRIRLADVRSELADVPRPELDQALRELERSNAAAMYPLDDLREIRPADDDAALLNSNGSKRHILYLSRPH